MESGVLDFKRPSELLAEFPVVAAYTKRRQIIATSRRVVSKNGREMAITTNSPDQAGQNVLSIGVYKKANEVADMEEKMAK